MKFFGIHVDVKGNYYLVTEFLAKGDLLSILRNSSELTKDYPLKWKIILGVAKALAHLEKRSIIHRDVACRNVLLDNLMQPKLVSFPHEFF